MQYLTLTLIWGLSFLFIKEGLHAFAPLQITLGRVAIGAAALLLVLLARRERLPRGARTWGHLAVAAVLNNVIPFSLFGYAEQRIPSALAGICNASAPLFAAVVAFAMLPDERLTRRRALGLVTGFAGVFVVLGAWTGLDGSDLTGALLALAGGLCYGIGFPYTRRFLTTTGQSSLSLAAGQLLCATVVLAVVTPPLTSAPVHWPATAVLSVLLLGRAGHRHRLPAELRHHLGRGRDHRDDRGLPDAAGRRRGRPRRPGRAADLERAGGRGHRRGRRGADPAAAGLTPGGPGRPGARCRGSR